MKQVGSKKNWRLRLLMQRIGKIQSKDIRLFITCLIGAGFLWLFNSLGKTYKIRLGLPIHFEYNQAKFVPIISIPPRVELEVTGTGWQILQQQIATWIKPLSVALPLEKATESSADLQGVKLSKTDKEQVYVELPVITLQRLISQRMLKSNLQFHLIGDLNLLFDKKTSRKVQIKINPASLSFAPTFQNIDSIKIFPNLIQIEGPSHIIDNLDNPLEINLPQEKTLQGDFDEIVPVVAFFNNNAWIKSSPKEVHIAFKVAKVVTRKAKIPVVKVNFPDDSPYALETDHMEVTYTFPEKLGGGINLAKDFFLMADYQKIDLQTQWIPLQLAKKPTMVLTVDFPTQIKLKYAEQ